MALAFIASALVALMGLNGDIDYRPDEDDTPPSLFFRDQKKAETAQPTPCLTGILFVSAENQKETGTSQCWINGGQFSLGDITPWGKIQGISLTTVTLETHTEPRVLSLQP